MNGLSTLQGLYLVKPHGELVYDGDKTAVAKARLFENIDDRDRVLCSDGRAFGVLSLGQPEEVSVDAFDARFSEHRVTVAERERWWPDAATLFLYPIVNWTPFDAPVSINVPPGTQTILECIDWGERPPAFSRSIASSTMPDLPASKKLDAAGPALPTASVSPSDGEKVGMLGAPSPQGVSVGNTGTPAGGTGCDVTPSPPDEQPAVHVDGTKEVSTMPFDIFKEDSRYCVYTVNEDGEKQGKTHGCHDTLQEARDQQKALYANVPEASEGEKAKWTRAYINNLPDSAFLYIESGGEKDEEGKTVPRTKRHLPYQSAEGNVDLAHLRDALGRLGQPKTGEQAGEPWLTEALRKRLIAKAQRILERATKSGVKEMLVSFISSLFGTPSSILWKSDSDALMGFKAADGRHWLVLWTTNAFQDREEEIFTTKAIEDYVERHLGEEIKGRFRYRHVPGSDFADIKLQAVVGRFLVEAGPFDQDWKGLAFQRFFQMHPQGHPTAAPQGWGASHGYVYHGEDREDRVYDFFDKRESSVVPAHLAANPWNPSLEVIDMDQTQKDALLDEFRLIGGDALAQHIQEVGVSLTKELEEGAVAYKEKEEGVTEEGAEAEVEEVVEETEEGAETTPSEEPTKTTAEVPAEPPPSEPGEEPANTAKELAAEVVRLLELEALGEAFKSLQGTIGTLDERLDNLETSVGTLTGQVKGLERTDDEKLAEKEQELPRFPWGSSFRPAVAPETVLTDEKGNALRKPSPPEAITRIVDGLQQQ